MTRATSAVDADSRVSTGSIPTWLIVGLLLLTQTILLGLEVAADSPTVDEPAYVHGGYWLLKGQPKLIEQPPLMMFVYGVAGRLFPPDGRAVGPGAVPWGFGVELTAARVANVVVTLLVGLLVFLWARREAGLPSAVAALGIAVVEPTLLGHGHLATLDVGAAMTYALTCYLGERLDDDPGPRRFIALVAGAGLALLTKWPNAILVVALPAASAVVSVQRHRTLLSATRRLLLHVAAVVVAAAAMLLLYAAWPGLGLHALQKGIAYQVGHVKAGHMSFLFGKVSCKSGWIYYPFALLVKTPLPLLVLAACGAVVLRRRAFVWATSILFLAAVTFSTVKIGIRYMLPAYPMLYVMGGAALGALWASRHHYARALVVALLSLLAASSLFTFPNHLGYVNELRLASRWGGQDWINDSNVDWGQGLERLASDAQRLRIRELCLDYFGPTWWGPGQAGSPLTNVRVVTSGCRYAAVSSFYLFAAPEHAPLRHLEPLNRGPIYIFDISHDPSLARTTDLLAASMRLCT